MKINKIIKSNEIEKCPENSGLYWLYKNTEYGWIIIYIGISNNIRRRLKEHTKFYNFDGFLYEIKDIQEARKKENHLLKSYIKYSGKLPLLNNQT